MLVTAGERKAMALLCMALADQGVDAESFTGSQAGFLTDSTHQDAKILDVRPERVSEALGRGAVAVVGGAQGISPERNITFLGRGGSDTTAVALAHALDAEVCELYTDVSGVYTTDPRVVDGARKLPRISFDELMEMTANGCPKPAMRSVEYARTHGVDLHVRSAFTWETGTLVTREDDDMEQAIVSAVVHDASDAKVTIGGVEDRPGIAARIFRALADERVSVDLIVQNTSEAGRTDISFTVPDEELATAMAVCEREAGDRRRRRDLGRPRHRTRQRHRRRDEDPPRGGGDGVRDAGGQRHQHRDDRQLGHPDLRGRHRRPGRARHPGPACRVPPRRGPGPDRLKPAGEKATPTDRLGSLCVSGSWEQQGRSAA